MSDDYIVPKELLDACNERMMLSRTLLILTFPFFGILASKLILVPNNTWCRTMAVDGKHFFYNVEFIMGLQEEKRRNEYTEKLKDKIPDITQEQINDALNSLSDKNLIAAICHELLHCAYDHFLRRGSRNPKKWNVAADYAINQILVRDKIGEIKSSWLFDPKFDGKSAEEIYNILESNKNNSSDLGTGNGGTLDQHDVENEFPDLSEEERQEYIEQFKDSMMSAAMAGGIPKELDLMLNIYKKPKIDWKSKIQRTIRSWIKNDVTYTSPSRRSWSNGFDSSLGFYGYPIIPGLKPDDEIDICVALDASGSISHDMLRDFLSEVIGITKQFKQFKLRILTFGTGVYEIKDYSTGQEDSILKYKIKAGGGTNFEAVFEHMKNDNYKPKQLVMFTDGLPSKSWGDKDYCKTLFVIHSHPSITAPFGDTVHY